MPRTSREMSMWMREHSKAQPPGATSYGWGGGPIYSDAFRFRRAPSLPALAEAYKSLIFTCVRLNADAVARVPLRLYRLGNTKGDRAKYCDAREVRSKSVLGHLRKLPHVAKAMAHAEEVEEITGDFPLLKLIEHVNPSMDQSQLIQYTAMSMDVVGTAFWWPTEYFYGAPRELWPLPPHLVYPQMDGQFLAPSAYQYGSQSYKPEDLVIFKHLSMKNPYGLGMSPTQAAIEYARLEDTFVSIQDDLLSNGPRPSVIVSPKDAKASFGDAERKRLEHDMNMKARGGRSGSAFVVDGPVSVTPVSWTPADLGAIEISKYDMERTAGCFGVPISMLTNESSNRAVAEAGLEQHARQAVDPRCKTIASMLTRWTHSLDSGGKRNWRKLIWAFDDCVPSDKLAEADLHTKYVAMGLPLNRALTEAGYDAIEGGDVSLVSSSLVSLENATRPPAPPPEMGKPAEAEDEGNGENPDDEPDPEPPTPDEDPDEDEPKGKSLAGVHAKNCGIGPNGFLPGNTCGGGSRPGVSPAALRRRKAGKRRNQGPKSGLGARGRSARRKREGVKAAARREFNRDAAAGKYGSEGKALYRENSRDRRELASTLRSERAEVRGEHRSDRKRLAKEIRTERASVKREQSRERATLSRRQERDTAKLESSHGKQTARLDARHEAERVRSNTPDSLAGKHQAQRADLAEIHRTERQELAAEQRQTRRDLRAEQRDRLKTEREDYQDRAADLRREYLQSVREQARSHRESIADLKASHRSDIADLKRSYRPQPASKAYVTKAEGDDVFPGWEGILRGVLEQEGLKDAWESRSLTDDQRLGLLHAVRMHARDWFRTEAESVLADVGELSEKALFGKAKAKVSAFFDKARGYVREVIMAGVMVIAGPGPVLQMEAIVDPLNKAVAVQHQYLAEFETQIIKETKPLDATFAARAELYGSSVWGGAQETTLAGSSAWADEARRLHRGGDAPCSDCKKQISRGWVKIEDCVPIGDTQCRCNCHCYLVLRSKGDNQTYVIGTGPFQGSIIPAKD